MWGRFPLTRVVIRVLEIAGAGLTSALVAYLLGRTEPTPPALPPAVVHLAPSDEEMIATVRGSGRAVRSTAQRGAGVKDPRVSAHAVDAPQVAPHKVRPNKQHPNTTSHQATSQQATSQQATSPTTPQSVLTTDVAVPATSRSSAPGLNGQERASPDASRPEARAPALSEADAKVDTRPRPGANQAAPQGRAASRRERKSCASSAGPA
jgi:hypothetical protein